MPLPKFKEGQRVKIVGDPRRTPLIGRRGVLFSDGTESLKVRIDDLPDYPNLLFFAEELEIESH